MVLKVVILSALFFSEIVLVTILAVLAILVTISIVHYGYCHWSLLARKLNKFPGSTFIPIVGTLDVFKMDKKRILNLQNYPFKTGYRHWIGFQPLYVTTDPDVIQQIVSSSFDKSDFYFLSEKIFGPNSILQANTTTWRPMRKQMNKSFHANLYKDFFEVFNRHTNNLLDFFEEKSIFGETNLQNVFTKFAMNIALETLLDLNPDYKIPEKDTELFLEAYESTVTTAFIILTKPWLRLPLLWNVLGYERKFQNDMKVIKDFLAKVNINKKHTVGKEQTNNEMKYVDIVNQNWSDPEEIFFHCLSILSGATDTTSVTLSTAMYMLATHKKVQETLYQECKAVLGENSEKDVTMEEINQMRYLDMVIKESMRMVSPGPYAGRKLDRDINVGNGLVLPKGCNVNIPLFVMNKDPKIFPEPNKFIPERFDAQPIRSFMPFLIGARNCIGQKYAMTEMKLAISKIVLKFELSTTRKIEDLEFEAFGPFIKFSGTFPIHFTRR